MNKGLILIFLLCGGIYGMAQQSGNTNPEEQMLQYWFVLLSKEPNRTQYPAMAAELQKKHLNNIDSLYNVGTIKIADPVGTNDDGRQGLFIFDCSTREEVEQLLQTDAAVKPGRLSYSIKPWYTTPIGSFVPGKPKAHIQ